MYSIGINEQTINNDSNSTRQSPSIQDSCLGAFNYCIENSTFVHMLKYNFCRSNDWSFFLF